MRNNPEKIKYSLNQIGMMSVPSIAHVELLHNLYERIVYLEREVERFKEPLICKISIEGKEITHELP